MAEHEVDVLGEAFGATEKEIFGEVTTGEPGALDETGDRSVEEMGEGLEGQHEPDEDGDADADEAPDGAESAEAGDKGDQARGDDGKFVKADDKAPKEPKEPKPADAEKNRVPLNELLSERSLRQAAEAARDADRKALADMNAKLDTALKQIETLKPKIEGPKADGEDGPDIFTDPKGFIGKLTEGIRSEYNQKIADVTAGTSMQIAHYKHGEVFEKAYKELTALPVDDTSRQLVQRLYHSPNPGEAIVAWHRQHEASKRIGSDGLDKYEERVRAETREKLMQDPEFRKQLIEDLRAEGSGKGQRPSIRLPKSLNGAAGGGSQRIADPDEFDNSETSVFSSAFR